MLRLLILLVISILLYSCGSQKSASSNLATTKSNISNKPNPNTTSDKEPLNRIKKETNQDPELSNLAKLSYTERLQKYVREYGQIAQEEMVKHRIPASIKMAQAILESGAGMGVLALKSNNHFGVKCHIGWQGRSVRYDDDAPNECFRKYSHPRLSFEDHSAFLSTRSRYNSLFKLDILDYKAWAKGLKKAGYATDPNYAQKLINIIETYHLYDLDTGTLGPNYSVEYKATEQPKPFGNKDNSPQSQDTRPVFSQSSNLDIYQVKKGDTLYSISKKYNISVEYLKTFNRLKGNLISVGQLLDIPKP